MKNKISLRHNKDYSLLKAFLYGILFSTLFFIPFLIFDNGYFLYYGDFNVQQIPFYQMIHDAIQSGNWKWSTTTDLGSSVIGSYSFYNLGSPFFWLTMLFPSKAVPYLMAPLFILKFGCASLAGCLYLKRYCKQSNFAVLGGLLYAFSGFSIYNIFFNHFHEAIIVFPLLLWAIDSFMYDKRRGVVAVTVFASCIVNYYFFVGQALFVLIYWLIKIFTKTFKFSFKEFLLLAFEVLLGFISTAILLIPSVLYTLQNPRLDALPNGWDSLVYSNSQRYLHIIESFFFPSDIPAFPNFTPNSNAKWASVGGWLPLVGMTGVIAFLQTKGKSFLKKLIALLILIAMVPVLNSAFQLFNSSIYYARWFYMFTLMLCLATVFSLENADVDWNRAIRYSAGITAGIGLFIGFMPNTTTDVDNNETTTLGVENYSDIFWVYVAIALISILLFTLLVKKYNNYKKLLSRACIVGLGFVIVFYSMFTIYLGKTHGYDTHQFMIPFALNNGKNVDLEDIDNVRSDFYECMDNLGMYWQIPNIQAFQSCVTGSIMDFYPSVGVSRDVNSHPATSKYGLRSFLSCKYLFDYTGDKDSFMDSDGKMLMPGWKYKDVQNGCYVYENEYYIPMGFMYDKFICEEEYEQIPVDIRHLALLKSMVLSQSQMKKYSDITGYKAGQYDALNSDNETISSTYSGITDTFSYNYEDYYADCNNRKATACSDFKYTKDGFTAIIDNKGDDNLLFFSVPYENGWSAFVDGKQVDIEKVNVGFMAVKVDGNKTSSIEFKYYPPGYDIGYIVTAVSIVIFIMYMLFNVLYTNKKSKRIKVVNKNI